MDDVLGLIALVLYIAAILALSMGLTWVVVKVSPSQSAKELKARERQASSGS